MPQARGGAGALFSGDHVMGWSTSIVSPPDGSMAAYVASLEKLLPRTEPVYYPAHGDPVVNPQRLVRGMIGHRRQREAQIVHRLAEADATVSALVARMYAGLAAALVPAAERSVLAHLIDLRDRGLVAETGAAWRRTT